MVIYYLASAIRFFFFNDTATTEIYTLSLHDALPISHATLVPATPTMGKPFSVTNGSSSLPKVGSTVRRMRPASFVGDRKSTRLNSSHANISYAVFCLKKKKKLFRQHSYLLTTIYANF